MRTVIFNTILLTALSVSALAQKNLDKLPEKERNKILIVKAKEAIMTHAPEWYREYKEPIIKSFVDTLGYDKGKLIYSVKYLYDPQKETLEYGYSVVVGIYADTGEVRGLSFGDGIGYRIPAKTRSEEKPFVRPYPYPKPVN